MSIETLSVVVHHIRQETPEIILFELRDPHGRPLPAFSAGAHIDVQTPGGVVRQYSLCNSPAERERYLIAVKREPASRGGSSSMHEALQVGDHLTIGVPLNYFPLESSALQHLLFAAGIGITPILCMALHLDAIGAPFQLHYFTRSVNSTAFHALLCEPRFEGRVVFHFGLEPDACRAQLRSVLPPRSPGTHVYLCGPRAFMDLVVETASKVHWASDAIHLEYFSADAASFATAAKPFSVKLARRGGIYTVPENKTIVQVLAEHGILIDTSCEQGVCGTCMIGVLDGVPEHHDVFLTGEEKRMNDRLMPCVSRAKSPVLVLDI